MEPAFPRPCRRHVQADRQSRPAATGPELREGMSGSIRRCGARFDIIDATTKVAGGPPVGAGT